MPVERVRFLFSICWRFLAIGLVSKDMTEAADGVEAQHSTVVRMVYDFLSDCGYRRAAAALQRDAALPCRALSAAEAAELKRLILDGEWDGVLEYATSELLLTDAAHFAIWEAIVRDLGAVAAGEAHGRGWTHAGIDPTAAREYAQELLARNDVLLRMRAAEPSRYQRLEESARVSSHDARPSHAGAAAGQAVPAWRLDAWASVSEELLNLAPKGGAADGESLGGDAIVTEQRKSWTQLVLSATTGGGGGRRAAPSNRDIDDAAHERRLRAVLDRRQAAGAAASRQMFAGLRSSATDLTQLLSEDAAWVTAIAVVNNRCVVGLSSGAVAVVSAEQIQRMPQAALSATVIAVAAVTDSAGTFIVAGARDGAVAAVRLDGAGNASQSWRCLAADSGVAAVAIAGNAIAVASFDGVITVLDATTGKRTHVLRGHVGAVLRLVALSPTREGHPRVLSCGADGSVRCWRVDAAGPEQPLWVASPFGGGTGVLHAVELAARSSRGVETRTVLCVGVGAMLTEVDIDAGVMAPTRWTLEGQGIDALAEMFNADCAIVPFARLDAEGDGSRDLESIFGMRADGRAALLIKAPAAGSVPATGKALRIVWEKNLQLAALGGVADPSMLRPGQGRIALAARDPTDDEHCNVWTVFGRTLATLT
jgi:hypothetical protein